MKNNIEDGKILNWMIKKNKESFIYRIILLPINLVLFSIILLNFTIIRLLDLFINLFKGESKLYENWLKVQLEVCEVQNKISQNLEK